MNNFKGMFDDTNGHQLFTAFDLCIATSFTSTSRRFRLPKMRHFVICLAVLAAWMALVMDAASNDADVHLCNSTEPSSGWQFHCFDKIHCLTTQISVCSNAAKCPDKSDVDKDMCSRLVEDKFECCPGKASDHTKRNFSAICDGNCECDYGCADEDVCGEGLKACLYLSGGTIAIIVICVVVVLAIVIIVAVVVMKKRANRRTN